VPRASGRAVKTFQQVGPYLYSNHRLLLLLHIGGGILALVLGLFQFVESLRRRRPSLHRLVGRSYIAAVVLSGMCGLPLSFLMFAPWLPALRVQFYPILAGLASLSVVWPVTALLALYYASQRRFGEHRAWTIRCFSLTFVAVSLRLVAPVLLLLTGSFVFSLNGAFLSWPLNLIVAEWVIRRSASRSESSPLRSVSTATT
jgi:uncharacterized membrane protein YozB (DUF420 family)